MFSQRYAVFFFLLFVRLVRKDCVVVGSSPLARLRAQWSGINWCYLFPSSGRRDFHIHGLKFISCSTKPSSQDGGSERENGHEQTKMEISIYSRTQIRAQEAGRGGNDKQKAQNASVSVNFVFHQNIYIRCRNNELLQSAVF